MDFTGKGYDIFAKVGAVDDGFTSTLARLTGVSSDTAGKMKTTLNAALAATGAMIVGAAVAATQFETSFAGVTKTVAGLRDPLGNLTDEGVKLAGQFRALALEIPLSVNELNKIGELGGQLGIAKEDLLGFTKTIAELGVTTNLTTEAAATAMAQFINVTKQVAPEGMTAADQIAKIGSAVVALGNTMATTEADIMEFSQRISGTGSMIGLTQDQILAFAASFSSLGINAEAGGTAFTKVMTTMTTAVDTGGIKLEAFARTAGMSADDFAKKFKEAPQEAILAFITGLGNIRESGGTTITTLDELALTDVRVSNALNMAAGNSELFKKALETSSIAYKENTALSAEAAQRFGTVESQLTLVKNQFYEMAITLGETFLPVIRDILKYINEHPGAFQAVVTVVGSLVAILGTATLAYHAYEAGVTAVTVAKGLFTTASKLMAVAMGPVGIAISAVVVAATALYFIYDKLKNQEADRLKGVVDSVTSLGELETKYNALNTIENKSAQDKIELQLLQDKLNAAYKAAGYEVNTLGDSYGNLSEAQKKIETEKITKEIEALQKQFESVDTATKIVTTGMGGYSAMVSSTETALSDAEKAERRVKIADQIKLQQDALDALNPKVQDNTTKTEANEKAQNALAAAIAPVKTLQEELSDLGVKTSAQYQGEIDKLESLLPKVREGSQEYKSLKDMLADLYEKMGLEGTDAYLKLTAATKDINTVTGTYINTTETQRDKIKELTDRQAELKAIIESTSFASMAPEEAGKIAVEYKKIQGEISGLFTQIHDSASKVPEKLEPITDKIEGLSNKVGTSTTYFERWWAQLDNQDISGYVGQISGMAIEFLNLGPSAEKGIGLVTGAFQSILTGSFDPVSFGLKALGTVFSLFGKDSKEAIEPIPLTLDQAIEKLGSVGDEYAKVTESLKSFNGEINSELLADYSIELETWMNTFKDGGGKSEYAAQKIAELTAKINELTSAFSFTDTFGDRMDTIDSLVQKAKESYDYFGTVEFPGAEGLRKLLYEQVAASEAVLKTLEPTSQAYKDLSEKIQLAKAAAGLLAGNLTDVDDAINKSNTSIIDLNGAIWENLSWTEKWAKVWKLLKDEGYEFINGVEADRIKAVAAEIESNKSLLAGMEPLSKEYHDMQENVWKAEAALAFLRKEVSSVDEWFVINNITLTEWTDTTADAAEQTDTLTESNEELARSNEEINASTIQMTAQVAELFSGWNSYIDIVKAVIEAQKDGFSDEFITTLESQKKQMESLTDQAIELRNQYGNIAFPELEADLQASIMNNLALLKSLDPLSPAYEEMQDEIWKAQAALAVLKGEVATVDEYFQKHGIVLNEIANQTIDYTEQIEDFNKQIQDLEKNIGTLVNKRAEIVIDFNIEKDKIQGQIDATILELSNIQQARTASTEKYRESQADLLVQIRAVQKEINYLTGADTAKNIVLNSSEYQDAASRLERLTALSDKMSTMDLWAGFGKDAKNKIIPNFEEISSLIEELTGRSKRLTIQWGEMFTAMQTDFGGFESDIDTANKALDQLLYFGQSLSESGIDKQINAQIWQMQDYLATLNPSSPAYADAKKSLDELIKRFAEMGGTLDKQAALDFFSDETTQGIDDIKAQIEAMFAAADSQVELDTAAAQLKIAELHEQLKALRENYQSEQNNYDLQTEEANAKLAALQDGMQTLIDDYSQMTIQIDADILAASQELAELKRQLNDLLGITPPPPPGNNPGSLHTGGFGYDVKAHSGIYASDEYLALLQKKELVLPQSIANQVPESDWRKVLATGDIKYINGEKQPQTIENFVSLNFDVTVINGNPNTRLEFRQKADQWDREKSRSETTVEVFQ